MRIIRKPIVNSNTLRNLVKTACDKYEAMEKGRSGNNIRSSKADKLHILIADKNNSSNQIAAAIIELEKQQDLGNKLKALVQALAICARTQLEKKEFENAYESLEMFKTKTFEESTAGILQQQLTHLSILQPLVSHEDQANADFNFTKAFQNILVPNALKLTRLIQQQAEKVNSEKHVHTVKPVVAIDASFIDAEKSKKLAKLGDTIEEQADIIQKLAHQLQSAKNLVIKNRHEELHALRRLHLSEANLKTTVKRLNKAETKLYLTDNQLTSAEVYIEHQAKASYGLKKLVVKNRKHELEALDRLKTEKQNTKYLLSVVNKADNFIEKQQSDINELSNALDTSNAFVDYNNDVLEFQDRLLADKDAQLDEVRTQANDDMTALRVAKVWEKKAALDKDRDVIMGQGRKIGQLVDELSIAEDIIWAQKCNLGALTQQLSKAESALIDGVMGEKAYVEQVNNKFTDLKVKHVWEKKAVSDKAREVIMAQGRTIGDLTEKLSDTLSALQQGLKYEQAFVEHVNDKVTELKVKHVWEKKAALDKAKEVIMRQGREINSLKSNDSMHSLRGTLFNQPRRTATPVVDISDDNYSTDSYDSETCSP